MYKNLVFILIKIQRGYIHASLKYIDHIHSRDSLLLDKLGVDGDVPEDAFREDLEDSTSLFISMSRDPLDSFPPHQFG